MEWSFFSHHKTLIIMVKCSEGKIVLKICGVGDLTGNIESVFQPFSYCSPQSSNVKLSSTSTVCFTALRANLHSSNSRLNQQPDVHLAHAAAQTFAAEGMCN